MFFFLMIRRPPRSTRTDTLFPYTTLFRSEYARHQIGFAYGNRPLGDRCCNSLDIDGLEAFLVQLRAVRLSGYTKNGHGIARCGIQTGQHVGAGGPRRAQANPDLAGMGRSEERRVGKECVSTCSSRWSPYHEKKQNTQQQTPYANNEL